MIKEIDISILFEKPTFEKTAIMWIDPLAPLSMVVSMPGSYYRSQGEPSPYMIYGVLENMLGWHFDDKIRRDILRKMKSELSRKFKIKEFSTDSSEVGFTQVLQQHLRIEYPAFFQPHKEFFEDYWTQHLKDSDERHLGGVHNYDIKIERMMNLSKKFEIQAKTEKDKDKAKELTNRAKRIKAIIMKRYKTYIPNYYSSPKKREFVSLKGAYGYKIHLSESVFAILTNSIDKLNAPLYIGTNEGWINLKLQTL